MPVAARSSSFWSRSVSSRGADSGRTTLAGCRSKVTTAEASPLSAARRFTSAMTALWPRCTPSYAPMVTAVPSGGRGQADRSRSTSIGRAAYRPRALRLAPVTSGSTALQQRAGIEEHPQAGDPPVRHPVPPHGRDGRRGVGEQVVHDEHLVPVHDHLVLVGPVHD